MGRVMGRPGGEYQLLVCDIDGTLLDSPHLVAWRRALRSALGPTAPPVTALTYQRHIAGRPREAGARAALTAVGAAPTPALVERVLVTKQDIFQHLSDRAALFPDARRLLRRAAEGRLPVAFCTASRNAGALLRRCLADGPGGDWLTARLDHSLSAFDGRGALDRAEMLHLLVKGWHADPSRSLLIDDTAHGVAAGEGIGVDGVLVDRVGDAVSRESGRWWVSSLDEIDLGGLAPCETTTGKREEREAT